LADALSAGAAEVGADPGAAGGDGAAAAGGLERDDGDDGACAAAGSAVQANSAAKTTPRITPSSPVQAGDRF